MLREAFGNLTIQVLEEYETELAEGEGHKGRSAVIGLIGTRAACAKAHQEQFR
jgi:hypothetical protein